MDGENPSIGPPHDSNDIYPTLSLDERLIFLTKLLDTENLADYSQILKKDKEIENSDAFK